MHQSPFCAELFTTKKVNMIDERASEQFDLIASEQELIENEYRLSRRSFGSSTSTSTSEIIHLQLEKSNRNMHRCACGCVWHFKWIQIN